MSKSDPKHFVTIDGHKFRKNAVNWALSILKVEPDWCPEAQSTTAVLLGSGSYVKPSSIPESLVKADLIGNVDHFCDPFMREAYDGRKYTKRKKDALLLFKVLKDQKRRKS